MSIEEIGKDTITLRGEEIELKLVYINQQDLHFFPENPRIYSIVSANGHVPQQNDIQKILQGREHVKQLAQSIKANGGLTDPIFVREDNFVVIEGNSRLAAYRLLAQKDPVKWGKIKGKLLPKDIDEDKVFSLLGEYHIIGKQDWAPFEQAGYLYRRHVKHGASIDVMAKSLGLTKPAVKKLISTYQFMIECNDTDPTRWSYYFEYLKSRHIHNCRMDYPGLDNVIVQKIKAGEITKAADIRDDLPKIIKAGKKVITNLIEGKNDFYECKDIAISRGVDDGSYQQIRKFRKLIVSDEVRENILNLPHEIRNKTFYELKKIRESIESLEKKHNKQ